MFVFFNRLIVYSREKRLHIFLLNYRTLKKHLFQKPWKKLTRVLYLALSRTATLIFSLKILLPPKREMEET